ncbi:MAG: MFS transporter [Mycobacteriales bacterium]
MLRTAPTWLKALLLGQLVSAAGSLAWLYLTLYLVNDRGLSAQAGGVITAMFGAGAIGGNLFGGSLGDRFGLREALAVTKGVALLSVAAFAVCPTAVLAPLALLAGLSGGAGRPLMSAVVATGMPAGLRREAIALSRAAFNAGTVVGPPLGGLLAAHHFGWIFLIDGATSAGLLVVVLCWVPRAAAPASSRRRGLLSVLRRDGEMRCVVLSVLAVDTTYRLLYTVVPLFLLDRSAPPWLYGLTISLNGGMIVLLEPRVARRLSARPALPVIGSGYAIVGAGWLVLGAVPSVLAAFVAVLVISVGEMLYKPTATAHAADLAPEGMAGRYQSLYASASIGGMLLSPLLGTTLYGAAPRLVWPCAAVVALAAAAVVGTVGRPDRRAATGDGDGATRHVLESNTYRR